MNKYDNLDEKKYLISSIDFFTKNFKVIDQKVNRGIDGFSVTTYQVVNDIPGTSYKAGEVFVTYHGTEPEVADLLSESGIIDKFIASEDDAPEPSEPYYENGTLMGTKGNDIINCHQRYINTINNI